MKYKDVKVKRKGGWLILSAPDKTDYELTIAHGSMSVMQAVSEYRLDVERILGKRKNFI